VNHPSSGEEVAMSCGVVSMGGGWHYRGTVPSFPVTRTFNEEVGPGKVYLVSDNRSFHDDSRDFGQLERASCKERIVFRLWSKRGWKDTKTRLEYIH
jgi:signal peptidase I